MTGRSLSAYGDPINAQLDWTSKNDDVVPFTLSHEIEVAETMLEFELACRAIMPDIELIDQHELFNLLPEETRNSPKPFACKFSVELVQFKKPLAITIIPDRLFRFRYTNDERHNFCLEQDRGTMSVGTKRTPLIGKSSFRKKQIGYFNLWKQGLHKQQWGFARFRVLTITTAEARIATMLQSQREVTNNTAAGLFLYTTPERIAEHGVLGPCWISAERDDVSLLDTRKD